MKRSILVVVLVPLLAFGQSSESEWLPPPPPPPTPVPEPAKSAQPSQNAAEKKDEAKKDEEKASGEEAPSLNLPIGWFLLTGVFTGLGIATGIFSAGPERDLRNPDKHLTRDETNKLYTMAFYLGVVSRAMYGLAGATGGWAIFKTQSNVRGYLTARAKLSVALNQPVEVIPATSLAKAPRPPPVSVGVGIGPNGSASFSLALDF